MKHLYRTLGLIAGLVVTAVFVIYVWQALRGHNLSVYASPRAYAGIVAAALIYMCCIPLSALAWQELLRGVGTARSWRELTGILGATQIAKYIPGNVGQYIGRGALSVKRGIPLRPFTVSTLMEVLLTASGALCVGVVTGALSDTGLDVVHAKSWQLLIVLALLVLAASGVWAFRQLAPKLLRHFAPQKAHLLDGELLPTKVSLASAFLLYCGTSITVGLALVALARILLPSAPHDNWLLLASCSLAWVVGFVTPGAPAGLGVREGLLLLMLAPVYGVTLASVLIIALRIVTTLGDVLNAIAGALLLLRCPTTVGTTSIHS